MACLEGISRFSPVIASKLAFRKAMGRRLNLKNPQTLNEKLMYLKLNKYWNDSTVAQCADKYRVRDYVTAKGYGNLLNGLLGVWERADDIDWDALPNRFVLKCNHGSGYNIICTDKTHLDREKAKVQLSCWLTEKFGVANVEQGIYQHIKPLILAEEFIETTDNLPPKDYKFFCSYGNVKLIFVASDRVNGNTKFDYYYSDWTWIPVENCHSNHGPIEKPAKFDEMISIAEALSKEFPLVRVDLYEESGRILFGELTFTHFGCIHGFKPEEYDAVFGKLFPIELS